MIVIPQLNLTAPPGSLIGVIEEGLPCLATLVRSQVVASDQPLPTVAGDFVLDHYFAAMSRVARARGISQVESLRRAGSSVILLSHDEGLLEQCADEIWWLRDGKLVGQGHPAEVLPAYRQHVARELRLSGEAGVPEVAPVRRQGMVGQNSSPLSWRGVLVHRPRSGEVVRLCRSGLRSGMSRQWRTLWSES